MLTWVWAAGITVGLAVCVIRTEVALELIRRIDARLARWEQQPEDYEDK